MRKSVIVQRGVLLLLLGIGFGFVSRLVNDIVQEPYMDEIFHVPQGQKYCLEQFDSWDDKITTPPGLYLITTAIVQNSNRILHLAEKWSEITVPYRLECSIQMLRRLNQIFGIGSIAVISHLIPLIHKSSTMSLTRSTVISIFPVAFFYHFLYYTDSGSTFFVLLSYALSLKGFYTPSAAAIWISLWFRQTNIAWAFFIAINSVIRLLSSKYGPIWKDRVFDSEWSPSLVTQAHILFDLFKYSLLSLPSILWNFWGYLAVAGSFIWFLVWNDGIVLGDKSNHVPGLHFPQLFYFFAFAAFFGLFSLNPIGGVGSFLSFLYKRVGRLYLYFFILGILGISVYLVQEFTLEHPFLLADNRHFSFYIWRYVFGKVDWVRYALIPGYLYVIWVALLRLTKTQTYIWILSYIMTISLVLIPSPLIEFRYFILPYLFLRLHVPLVSGYALFGEFLFHASVNVIVFWLFLYKDFEWENTPGRQRFMW